MIKVQKRLCSEIIIEVEMHGKERFRQYLWTVTDQTKDMILYTLNRLHSHMGCISNASSLLFFLLFLQHNICNNNMRWHISECALWKNIILHAASKTSLRTINNLTSFNIFAGGLDLAQNYAFPFKKLSLSISSIAFLNTLSPSCV